MFRNQSTQYHSPQIAQNHRNRRKLVQLNLSQRLCLPSVWGNACLSRRNRQVFSLDQAVLQDEVSNSDDKRIMRQEIIGMTG